MLCNVEKSTLSGTILCPASKSYTHRAIFLATLSEGTSIIHNPLLSNDTEASIRACKMFGAQISKDNHSLQITGVQSIKSSKIDAANSGTTIRIATAIASLADGTSTLWGDESLSKRPMGSLLKALYVMGANVDSDDGTPPISITGVMSGGRIEIPGDVSSQYISALLIAGAKSKNGIMIDVSGDRVSKDYISYTIDAMRCFGAKVERTSTGYSCIDQQYHATEFTIPHDMSILSLLVAAKVLLGDDMQIHVGKAKEVSESAHVVEICSKMGADVILEDGACTVNYTHKDTKCIDLTDQPDLLPAIAILALKSPGTLTITGISHTKYKETDRIAVISEELTKIGVKIVHDKRSMKITHDGNFKSATFDCRGDHRLFMAFCIAAMHIGGCTVTDPESVSVSYPGFIAEMNALGGKIQAP